MLLDFLLAKLKMGFRAVHAIVQGKDFFIVFSLFEVVFVVYGIIVWYPSLLVGG